MMTAGNAEFEVFVVEPKTVISSICQVDPEAFDFE
jgi:hypothetical protein